MAGTLARFLAPMAKPFTIGVGSAGEVKPGSSASRAAPASRSTTITPPLPVSVT